MRVAIDFQWVKGDLAGIGRYTRSLAENLRSEGCSDSFVGLSFGRESPEVASLAGDNFSIRRMALFPRRAMSFLWRTLDWPPADWFTGPVDVFHFPSFVARPLRSARAVVTVHDLAFRRVPDLCEPKNAAYLSRHVPRSLSRAKFVIVDSEFTASELTQVYGFPAQRIRVVPLGVDDVFRPVSAHEADHFRRANRLPERYILFVGTVEPRKNIGTLLEAYALLRGRMGDAPPLVVAGAEGWRGEGERIARKIEALGLSRSVVRLGYVASDRIPGLYASASLFVFPSIYEGFGLPPLEAMACGAPVICSNAGSLPEVTGGAAVLVEPLDTEGISRAMEKMLGDPVHREETIRRGIGRAKGFTWRNTARRTLAVYREAALPEMVGSREE